MSTNLQETYADQQVLTVAAAHTGDTVVDHGPEGLGITEGLWIEVAATVLFAGPTADLTVLLESSVDEAFSSPVVEITKAIVDQTPGPGDLLLQQHMPVVLNQFTRVRITHTTNASAGAFSAYLTDAPQSEQPHL